MKRTRPFFLPSLIVLAAGLALQAQAHEAGHHHHHDEEEGMHQLGAHVHGLGTLAIAADGGVLALELDAPLANIAGFEHAPRNEDEKAALDTGIAKLKAGSALFVFNAEAGCRLAQADVPMPRFGKADDHGHDHDHHAHHEGGHDHADIHAAYTFECTAPQALRSVDIGVFDAFAGFEELEVTFLGDDVQAHDKLTAGQTRFKLR